MLGDRTRGLTVFAGTRDLIPPTAAALRNGPTCPHSPSTHEADGRPHVHPRLPTPEGRAARPDPGPQYFPTGTHAAASYAARSRTPPPVRGRGARSANTARRSTR